MFAEGQERLEQVESHRQKAPEDDLFDLVDRLSLVGGTAEAFDEGPEGRKGPVDGFVAAGLFGGGVGLKTTLRPPHEAVPAKSSTSVKAGTAPARQVEAGNSGHQGQKNEKSKSLDHPVLHR